LYVGQESGPFGEIHITAANRAMKKIRRKYKMMLGLVHQNASIFEDDAIDLEVFSRRQHRIQLKGKFSKESDRIAE
jgi:hypothetical protein